MKFYGKQGPIDLEVSLNKDLETIKKAQGVLFGHPYIDFCIIYNRHGQAPLSFMHYKVSVWGFQVCGIYKDESICSEIIKNVGI